MRIDGQSGVSFVPIQYLVPWSARRYSFQGKACLGRLVMAMQLSMALFVMSISTFGRLAPSPRVRRVRQ